MFATDSYHELLSARATGHNFVVSAWFVLLAAAVFMLAAA
jgi:hypothetical protein